MTYEPLPLNAELSEELQEIPRTGKDPKGEYTEADLYYIYQFGLDYWLDCQPE